MPRYLVETFVPRNAEVDLGDAIERAQRAAWELSDGGVPVRHLRSIFVGEDEVCFHLFESTSIQAVEELGRRARLEFNRVSEAIEPVSIDNA